jgi:hypothetical protein
MRSPAKAALVAAVALVAVVLQVGLVSANFKDDCDITWEPKNAKMDEGGNHLTLSLVSNSSGIYVSFCAEMSIVLCLLLLLYYCNMSICHTCLMIDACRL